MEDLEVKIEDGGLWIENTHSRYADFDRTTPTFDTHIYLFILCRELRYFEDIVKL